MNFYLNLDFKISFFNTTGKLLLLLKNDFLEQIQFKSFKCFNLNQFKNRLIYWFLKNRISFQSLSIDSYEFEFYSQANFGEFVYSKF